MGRRSAGRAAAGRLHPSEVQDFWNQRHASGDAYARARRSRGQRRSRPEIDYVHVALASLAEVSPYRRESLEFLGSRGFHVHQTGLWVLRRPFFTGVFRRQHQRTWLKHIERLLVMAQDAGGAMEYCHGVGLRLAPLMCREHGSGLAVMQRVKREIGPERYHESGKARLVVRVEADYVA